MAKAKKKKAPEGEITAYCVKCRDKRVMKDPVEVTMKGKGKTYSRALKGVCPKCGTKMFRILGKT